MATPPGTTGKPKVYIVPQETLDYYARNRKTYDGPEKKTDDKVKEVSKDIVEK